MAGSYTFDTLKDAIMARVGDTSTAFEDALPGMIGDAETRLLRDLGFSIWDTVGTFTLTSSVDYATMPTGALNLDWIYWTTGTTRAFLQRKTLTYLADYWPDTSQTSTPLYWAPLTETTIRVAPTPSATVTATTQYMARPTGLSASTTTTWLSTNVADCLLHACMIEAEKHGVADDRIAVWRDEYAVLVIAAQNEFRHLMRADYAPISPTPRPKEE